MNKKVICKSQLRHKNTFFLSFHFSFEAIVSLCLCCHQGQIKIGDPLQYKFKNNLYIPYFPFPYKLVQQDRCYFTYSAYNSTG